MARRYSGTLRIHLYLVDDYGLSSTRAAYRGYVGGNELPTMAFSGLSVPLGATCAWDSSQAYDLAAEAALGFFANVHEEAYRKGELDPGEERRFLVRRSRDGEAHSVVHA
ncbi:MAG: hypothetical protein H0X04_00375 [Chthoniobacterales bacterium]|nr:hypothetical protein [Chthoniobacterales bacterium]